MSLDKYIHSEVEDKIYSYWQNNNLFKPKHNKKKFSIVIPPPNITGSLHMGHALNNSIQDLLVRYHRMNNFETLWQPGTDHAGIATQALVEKYLSSKNISKKEIGREKFIEKVWEWKNQYGDIIVNQLKKLGCSCDWSRNAFTMDVTFTPHPNFVGTGSISFYVSDPITTSNTATVTININNPVVIEAPGISFKGLIALGLSLLVILIVFMRRSRKVEY